MNKQSEKDKPSGFSWDWGKGITVAIVLFIISTLSVVAYVVSLDYHMVTENHYERAVNYQEHIDRVEQASAMSQPVQIKLMPGDRMVRLQFPNSLALDNLKGTVELYRPNDSSMDQKIDLNLNQNGIQEISSQNLARGKWLVKVSWSSNGQNYFKEESIFL
ncbi:hypothetical protein G3570_12920 [Balneolaceae bacterium YR4-1]|uniref:Nitrogen fixation protein FixH n=1 Tax=Halalkalibaculum roseum TaxID=2709311 RepID=A0A6M1TBR5_9BACT|nr:FixH family protein [Halalkalibaculum roseum]NGP77543.1 hypothetical protein [Halalkalibaculum roseum]